MFGRELVCAPRRRFFYLQRSALVVLAGVFIFFGLLMATQASSTTQGLEIFMMLSVVTLAGLCPFAAYSAASMILREKEERTLGLLFLSDITPWQFVLSKLLTCLFTLTLAILSVLPVFMLAVSLGGVGADQILTAFALLLSAVFMVSCAGLFAAACMRNEQKAGALLVAMGIAYLVVLPAVVALLDAAKYISVSQRMFVALSPFAAMTSLVYGRYVGFGFANVALNVALGIAGLCGAAATLPSRVFSRETPPLTQAIAARLKQHRRLRRWMQPSPIWENAVAWRDYHFVSGGHKAVWMKFLITLAAAVGGTVAVCVRLRHYDASLSAGRIAQSCLIMTCLLCTVVAVLAAWNDAGTAFYREKRGRTLELLLLTDLGEDEIIRGKLSAVLLAVLPWIGGAVIAAVAFCVTLNKKDALEGMGVAALEATSMAFGYGMLAFWLSLRCQRNVAFGLAILLAVLWNTLGRGVTMILLVPFRIHSGTPMIVLDVAVHVVLGLVCWQMLRARFRERALDLPVR